MAEVPAALPARAVSVAGQAAAAPAGPRAAAAVVAAANRALTCC
ncbi:hypothetical protein [Klebsiella pneumoniae]|nr:hypothetical protein [Klebsiella pneumoniae]